MTNSNGVTPKASSKTSEKKSTGKIVAIILAILVGLALVVWGILYAFSMDRSEDRSVETRSSGETVVEERTDDDSVDSTVIQDPSVTEPSLSRALPDVSSDDYHVFNEVNSIAFHANPSKAALRVRTVEGDRDVFTRSFYEDYTNESVRSVLDVNVYVYDSEAQQEVFLQTVEDYVLTPFDPYRNIDYVDGVLVAEVDSGTTTGEAGIVSANSPIYVVRAFFPGTERPAEDVMNGSVFRGWDVLLSNDASKVVVSQNAQEGGPFLFVYDLETDETVYRSGILDLFGFDSIIYVGSEDGETPIGYTMKPLRWTEDGDLWVGYGASGRMYQSMFGGVRLDVASGETTQRVDFVDSEEIELYSGSVIAVNASGDLLAIRSTSLVLVVNPATNETRLMGVNSGERGLPAEQENLYYPFGFRGDDEIGFFDESLQSVRYEDVSALR